MKRITISLITVSLLLGLSSFISSETFLNKTIEQEKYKLILGEFKLKDLKATINKNWFEAVYKKSELKPEVVKKMASVVKGKELKITVYMGTWCEDSQREFPRFIKLLDEINFNYKNLTLVGVDEDKVVPNLSKKERERLNVFNVPTIIVYERNGTEINRFVEFPQETLEEDLLKIVSKEDYKHVYDF